MASLRRFRNERLRSAACVEDTTTATAGIAAMDPFAFMFATIVGRTLHFAMVGAVLVFCGPRIMAFVTRYERAFVLASLLVLIAAVIVFHFR